MSSDTMRAILVKDEAGHAENLYIGETPKPSPGAGEVRVKIAAFGINRMDILQREGGYPLPPGASKILGVEFAGVVDAIGDAPAGDDNETRLLREAVARWQVGAEVFGLASGGAYAEYIVTPATHILHKPKHLSFVEAAGIPENWLTAYQALILNTELKSQDNVLIHAAASGVGISAIQLAKLYGANAVIGTTSSQDKIDFITSIPNGATAGLNYREQDFAAETKKLTGGHGADVLIDFVGQSHWRKNIESLAIDGRMVMLGFLSGDKVSGDFDLGPILYKRLRIQGSTLRSRTVGYQAELIKRFEDEVVDKITNSEGDGRVRVYISSVYPWEKVQDAHREMEANSNSSGKIICEVS